MKKIIYVLIASGMLLTFQPTQSNAATTNVAPITTTITSKTNEAKANTLVVRLNEIKAMDKSNLNSIEKKNLRKEVRSIRQELKQTDGGMYLSVGAVIIILLLLIILL